MTLLVGDRVKIFGLTNDVQYNNTIGYVSTRADTSGSIFFLYLVGDRVKIFGLTTQVQYNNKIGFVSTRAHTSGSIFFYIKSNPTQLQP